MTNPLVPSRSGRVAANDGEYFGADVRSRPGAGAATSPREAWYMAAWSHEVLEGSMLARTVLGESLTLSRPFDRRVLGCGHPVEERGGIVWIWMGETPCADASSIPELPSIDGPSWVLGMTEEDDASDAGCAAGPDRATARTRMFIRNEALSPALSLLTGLPEGRRCDRWIDVRWHAPGTVLLQAEVALHGQPRELGVRTWHMHLVTPASPGRALRFYALNLAPAGDPAAAGSPGGDARIVRARPAFERFPAWEHVVKASRRVSSIRPSRTLRVKSRDSSPGS